MYSFCRFSSFICLSFHPSVSVLLSICPWFCLLTLSITKFYLEFFWLLITLQPLIKNFSYLVWGYLEGFSSILHLWTPGWCPRAGARGQNLGHPNKIVCLYKQLLNKEGLASDMFITSTFSVIRTRSLWPYFHAPVILPYILKTISWINASIK